MVGKIAEGNIESIAIDVMVTKEVQIDQDKGHSQGVTVAIELGVQVVVDLGQDPEPVPIETGQDAIIAESMTILQGIAPPLEKRRFRTIAAYVKFGRGRANISV